MLLCLTGGGDGLTKYRCTLLFELWGRSEGFSRDIFLLDSDGCALKAVDENPIPHSLSDLS